MNRLLRSKFANKEAFEKALFEIADTDKNGNLSVDEMQCFVIDQCREDLKSR